jgi:hypothetical protein
MEGGDPSNEAIGLYLDVCHNEDTSARDIQRYLRYNPFEGDIRRYLSCCKRSYHQYGKFIGVVEKD